MKNIALIPARAGSKRIPNKNTYKILGKPALVYAIETAKETNLFTEIHVSTDSLDIASLAESNGAIARNLREQRLSGDHTKTIEVVSSFLKSQTMFNKQVDFVCCIYPITPLLTANRILEGFDLVTSFPSEFSIAASPLNSHPNRTFMVSDNKMISLNSKKYIDSRTQDLPPFYQDAGQFYWASKQLWLNSESILGSNCRAVVFDKHEVVDVDQVEDLLLIEKILIASKNI